MQNLKEINIVILDNTNDSSYNAFKEVGVKTYKNWVVFKTFEETVEFIKNQIKDDEQILVLLHANGKEGYNKIGHHDGPFKFTYPNLNIYYVSTISEEVPRERLQNYTLLNIGELKKGIENGVYIPQYKKDLESTSLLSDFSVKSITDNEEMNKKDDVVKNIQVVLLEYTKHDNEDSLYKDFNSFIEYLKSESDENWLRHLLNKEKVLYPNSPYFENLYWNFRTSFFDTYFPTSGDKYEINLNKEKANVHFDKNHKWHINIRLFRSFISKYTFDTRFKKFFENEENKEIENLLTTTTIQAKLHNFKRLMRLFILHEALHKIHNIDEFSVNGIGYHPRIVEEADYQADAFVMISEFFYTYSKSKENHNDKTKVINLFIEIIKVAINTTMSFAGKGKLRSIQVRRFQRYTIWIFILALIEQLRTNSSIKSIDDTISAILDIFSNKPILDIYGLNTTFENDENADSKETTPQLYCYDLESYFKNKDKIKIGYFHKNFVDKRSINTEQIDMLIKGIQESEYTHLERFIDSIKNTVKFS